MTIMMKTFNDEVNYTEVQDDHVKTFKKRGWIEAPKGVKIEPPAPSAPAYNTDLSTATREVLIQMAVEKEGSTITKGKAAQMKKENLIKYLTDGEIN